MKRPTRVGLGECLFNARGQRVARLENVPGRGVGLVKTGADPEVHRLRLPAPAWAAEVAHLDALRAAEGTFVQITTKEGEVLTASLTDFDRHGRVIDYRHGSQMSLAVRFWRSSRDAGRQMTLFRVTS